MTNELVKSILTICSALNNNSVQFLIVGGTAVAFHGYFRPSINMAGQIADKPDLDFWYNPNYNNYFKLLEALGDLEQITAFKEETAPNPKKSFFKVELDNFTLDFLPEIKSGIDFHSCFSRKEIVKIENVEIPFISLEDILLDKSVAPRAKDLDDIQQLKQRIKKS